MRTVCHLRVHCPRFNSVVDWPYECFEFDPWLAMAHKLIHDRRTHVARVYRCLIQWSFCSNLSDLRLQRLSDPSRLGSPCQEIAAKAKREVRVSMKTIAANATPMIQSYQSVGFDNVVDEYFNTRDPGNHDGYRVFVGIQIIHHGVLKSHQLVVASRHRRSIVHTRIPGSGIGSAHPAAMTRERPNANVHFIFGL